MSVHRLLSRREKHHHKVNNSSKPSILPSLLQLVSWPFGSREDVAATSPSAKGRGIKRRASIRSSLVDLSFALDGAASLKRPRKRSNSSCVLNSDNSRSEADRGILPTLQSRDDHGNFGGIFVLDEKKKSDKEEDKKVCTQTRSCTHVLSRHTGQGHIRQVTEARNHHNYRGQHRVRTPGAISTG